MSPIFFPLIFFILFIPLIFSLSSHVKANDNRNNNNNNNQNSNESNQSLLKKMQEVQSALKGPSLYCEKSSSTSKASMQANEDKLNQIISWWMNPIDSLRAFFHYELSSNDKKRPALSELWLIGASEGDLHQVLAPLILSHAYVIDKNNPIIYIDPLSGNEIAKDKIDLYGKIIKIPNLQKTSSHNDTQVFLFLGNYFGNGPHSLECFFTLRRLFKQEKSSVIMFAGDRERQFNPRTTPLLTHLLREKLESEDNLAKLTQLVQTSGLLAPTEPASWSQDFDLAKAILLDREKKQELNLRDYSRPHFWIYDRTHGQKTHVSLKLPADHSSLPDVFKYK